jgi:hypothetical protein
MTRRLLLRTVRLDCAFPKMVICPDTASFVDLRDEISFINRRCLVSVKFTLKMK